MASTWEDVLNAVYNSIRNQWAALGYATLADARVFKYLPEHTASNLLDEYFFAKLSGGGDNQVRAWGLDAAVKPLIDSTDPGVVNQQVTLAVNGWYEVGIDGEGIDLLRRHMSLVQAGVVALGVTLGGALLRIEDYGQPSFGVDPNIVVGDEGQVLRANWVIIGENPNGAI